MGGMFFPPDFNLIDLESLRRRHVLMANIAESIPVIQMHLSLVTFYEERIAAMVQYTKLIGWPDQLAQWGSASVVD